jgi:aryl-alcohol dehydrogenase-like predicted oxidoreductase
VALTGKRKLGHSGIEIKPLALGGNVFGWTADEAASFKVLDSFVDNGFSLIDTADMYSAWAHGGVGGQSETIIGKWLKQSGKRQSAVIATKVGLEAAPGKKGLAPAYIKQAVEESLKRLQTDYIDLYQSHTDDASVPLEETLSAYADLIKEGKVRAIGASNYTGARLEEALKLSEAKGLPRYESIQPEYNLYDRLPYESDIEPVVLKEGIGSISYFSLASGFLTGKYRSETDIRDRARAGMLKKYLNERGLRIIGALDEAAKQLHATPAEIALAWLIARPSVTAPIASATSTEQLATLLKATELRLDDETIRMLNEASAERSSASETSSGQRGSASV